MQLLTIFAVELNSMQQLDDPLDNEIQILTHKGDSLAIHNDYAGALTYYHEALSIIPKPIENWEASTWVLISIGNVNYLGKNYFAAIENFRKAQTCPEGKDNSVIHLRLGQCFFETGYHKKAANEFTLAYTLEGELIFEDEDPKYFEFLLDQIKVTKA